jgi:L-ascorbate metabolism protein UlaG (beta-lactamase superfamily)
MPSEKVYLKQQVLAEPLFNQWYAWSYLIPPPTAAMYIANSHLRIMKSFLAAPQTHISALKKPEMAGGPFINYDQTRVNEVRELLDRTTREQARLLELAEAIKSLDSLLAAEAGGYSLEPAYEKVPDPLKGYVELVYDLNNHPSVRFIEGLLYKSPYYNPSSQSIALSLIEKDSRSFVFSTPRIEGNDSLHVRVPFNHKGIDELFKSRSTPQAYDYLKDILNISEGQDEVFSTFFTTRPPSERTAYSGDDVRIRYFGHACLLVETKHVSILTDPLISYKYETELGRYSCSDLPEKIDYVLITHQHQDHCLFEFLLQLRHKIKTIIVPRSYGGGLADPSLRLLLQNIGFCNVRELDEIESLDIEGGSITGVPFLGEHADLNIRSKLAYLITLNNKSLLCAADSNNVEPKLYQMIYDLVGSVEIIFLGMECVGGPLSWLYGPLLTKPLSRNMDQSRRFNGSNYEKAVSIVNLLKPKHVYVYAMGQEPWLTFLTSLQYDETSTQIVESDKLIEDCLSCGIIAERLYCQKEIFM